MSPYFQLKHVTAFYSLIVNIVPFVSHEIEGDLMPNRIGGDVAEDRNRILKSNSRCGIDHHVKHSDSRRMKQQS